MTPELEFLKAWMAWVENGANKDAFFSRSNGLCGLAIRFDKCNESTVEVTLQSWFKEDGLDRNYPFNLDSSDYFRESANGERHTNPRRLAWVKAKITELEKQSHEHKS